MKTTYERLKEIIEMQLNVHPDQIVPEARFIEDLGMDSLDTVEIIMHVEENMADLMPNGIPDKAIEHVRTFQEAVDAINAFLLANAQDEAQGAGRRRPVTCRFDLLVRRAVR